MNVQGMLMRAICIVALVTFLSPMLNVCTAQQKEERSPSRAVSQSDDSMANRIATRLLSALVETNGVPGMGAAIWRKDRLVWSGSAGYRDAERKQPVDQNTIFRLASVSKLFAATATARLMEQGSLDVNTPVQRIVRYLPDRWPAISTAQLAAHTSGIPHYQAVDQNRGGRAFASVREAVGVFQDRDLLFPPGERYSYSSYGYTLLSAVVEEVSGLSYLEYLSRHLTSGLIIGRDATDTVDPNASKAYEFVDGAIRGAAPHDYSYGWGGAGLGATAPDLAKFGGRVLTGQIISRATFEWMLLPAYLADGLPVVDTDRTPGGTATTIGLGWRSVRDIDGARIAHHSGVTNGARSTLVLYPDRALAVSLLSNALWVSAIEQTAIMLAAPFASTELAEHAACPTDAVAFDGLFNGQPVSGSAKVVDQNGLCTAEISVRNTFGAWLNGFPQNDAESLKLIGVETRGGFSRAALVTPIGIYDLRLQDGGNRYLAMLGGTRTISINFRPADSP